MYQIVALGNPFNAMDYCLLDIGYDEGYCYHAHLLFVMELKSTHRNAKIWINEKFLSCGLHNFEYCLRCNSGDISLPLSSLPSELMLSMLPSFVLTSICVQ
ncbi:hypothetical protein [Absidia glauca]|uniref:Uncharacterized protein n=1 Tax=Absidia glauca TaxID=4829 RepID=A0A168L0L6_ABSGL|nr:hypothetical protein [Absidia glauca]